MFLVSCVALTGAFQAPAHVWRASTLTHGSLLGWARLLLCAMWSCRRCHVCSSAAFWQLTFVPNGSTTPTPTGAEPQTTARVQAAKGNQPQIVPACVVAAVPVVAEGHGADGNLCLMCCCVCHCVLLMLWLLMLQLRYGCRLCGSSGVVQLSAVYLQFVM